MIYNELSFAEELPLQFNNPFHYSPHPLCQKAMNELQQRIALRDDWREEIAKGKMFGVLVVQKSSGEVGWIAAYSGQIGGRSDWNDFVPAVFDYLEEGGFFKRHEEIISQINRKVVQMASSDERKALESAIHAIENEAENAISEHRKRMAEAKKIRQTQAPPLHFSLTSEYLKAELRRIKKRYSVQLDEVKARLRAYDEQIISLKDERHERSDALQRWLFQHFIMLNARGDRRSLLDIFQDYCHQMPPSGAGECCAPKLLQYAFLHDLRPICMAEFWWGASPSAEVRHHLQCYPACNSKCKPILSFMLQGLNVEPNALDRDDNGQLRVVYEDEFLAVIDKPSGMLSVPGKGKKRSVVSLLQAKWGEMCEPLVVHRLDMDTSGLLIVAKKSDIQKALQAQFARREIRKLYVALLDSAGENIADAGEISLPLRTDIADRPRQLVDFQYGKPAITRYKIIERSADGTLIALTPLTGRTHQLRLHCAHQQGLGAPIRGDRLYGTPSSRLFLHAQWLQFRHPATGKTMQFTSDATFCSPRLLRKLSAMTQE